VRHAWPCVTSAVLACAGAGSAPVVEAPVVVEIHAAPRAAGPVSPLPAHGTPAPADDPFDVGTTWIGTYDCAQGATDLSLEIARVNASRIEAVFDFAHEPSGASGKFSMHGTYEPASRVIRLQAGDWLERPASYVTVDLTGHVSADGRSVTGQVIGPGCGRFSLNRLGD